MIARAMATPTYPSLPFGETPDASSRLDESLLSVEDLANYLAVPVKTIYTRRHRNSGRKASGWQASPLSLARCSNLGRRADSRRDLTGFTFDGIQ